MHSPRFFHRLLFLLDPETAHHLAIRALKALGFSTKKTPLPTLLLKKLPQVRFANRLGLAAGFDKNAEAIAGLTSLGFGFIEVGTVTPLPQEGNPPPRIWREKNHSLVNKLGFNNCGLEEFKKNLLSAKQKVTIPIFANIGKNKVTENENAHSDYEKGFLSLKDVVSGFIVNISSPNTPGLRDLQTEGFIEKLVNYTPKDKPVLIKLSADLVEKDLRQLLEQVKRSSLSGVVLVNTSTELAQKLANRNEGGYSGPSLFSKTCEKVAIAKEILKEEKLIIGVGGVSQKEDYLKLRKLGADLVEVYTAFIYQGPTLIKELASLE